MVRKGVEVYCRWIHLGRPDSNVFCPAVHGLMWAQGCHRFKLGCYEHRLLGLGAVLAHTGCLLYLVAQLPLPLFFRFVVLVTVHLYDPL
jgi:hypothetical protein